MLCDLVPFSYGSSLIKFGELSNSSLTSVIVPLNGAFTSATAFTLSNTVNCLSLSTTVPTSGTSTYTNSPSLSLQSKHTEQDNITRISISGVM